ncbi:hypothetical protein BD769DRAFT_1433248 [Suillus cothurnatus]|nr:hypothetical protein BD769DRAFT_1433248 [Suillus cothurnatus]
MTKPFVLRWGIISTGRIANCFVTDLLVDPERSVSFCCPSWNRVTLLNAAVMSLTWHTK